MNTGELTDKISDRFCCRKFFDVIESNNCVFLTVLNCFGLMLVMVTSFKSTRKLSLLCAFNEVQRQFKARHKMPTLKTDMLFLHKIITNNYSIRTIICINTGNKKQLYFNCLVASHPESYKFVVSGRSSDLSLSVAFPFKKQWRRITEII